MKAKERNRLYVLNIAKKVYLEKGISGVSMTDIAEATDFGVASIYRYFGTRNSLIIECAVSLWLERVEKIKNLYEKSKNISGFDQLKTLTRYFPWLIVGDKEFSRFLMIFDAFLISEEIAVKDRKKYDDVMYEFYKYFEMAYQRGREDGTVREIANFEDFYFAATQSLLSLSQKLALRGNIISTDKSVKDKINMLINLYTDYVSVK